MVVAVADCSIAGVSGDMFLGALVDLCGEWKELEELANALPKIMKSCSKVNVKVERVKREGIVATSISLLIEEEKGFTGRELLDYVEKAALELSLSKRAYRMAVNAANLLVESEAKVHNEKLESIYLHELGSADTVFDMVGAALMCEKLDLLNAEWFVTSVAVGEGRTMSSHGSLPVPTPVVVEILRKARIPMSLGPVQSELATPTGVAIVASLKTAPCKLIPPITILNVGYGAGRKELTEIPNVFRVMVGDENSMDKDEVVVIVETNVDDVSGEIIAYASEKLIKAGARDVSIIPVIAKKGRPGCIVQAICTPENYLKIAEILIRETGTLGVRIHQCKRLILERELILFDLEINGKKHPLRVKVARDKKGKIIRAKPEFEDLKKISEETGKPVRDLIGEFERHK